MELVGLAALVAAVVYGCWKAIGLQSSAKVGRDEKDRRPTDFPDPG